MTERRKQKEFVKSMLHFEEENDTSHHWQRHLDKAEREEKCVSCSLRMVVFLSLMGLCGLAYCRLFLSGSLMYSNSILVKFFFALMVSSGFCAMVFSCVWLYYRHLTDQVYANVRNQLLSGAQTRFETRHFARGDTELFPRNRYRAPQATASASAQHDTMAAA